MAAVGAKEKTFDVWMKQESDTVQALGMAYAERETIEASYRVIQQVTHGECIKQAFVSKCLQCMTRAWQSCKTDGA